MMKATATADDRIFDTMGFLRWCKPAAAWRRRNVMRAQGKEQRT